MSVVCSSDTPALLQLVSHIRSLSARTPVLYPMLRYAVQSSSVSEAVCRVALLALQLLPFFDQPDELPAVSSLFLPESRPSSGSSRLPAASCDCPEPAPPLLGSGSIAAPAPRPSSSELAAAPATSDAPPIGAVIAGAAAAALAPPLSNAAAESALPLPSPGPGARPVDSSCSDSAVRAAATPHTSNSHASHPMQLRSRIQPAALHTDRAQLH